MKLQQTLALAEAPTKAGVAATKYAAAIMTGPRAGIEGAVELLRPRRPYEQPEEGVRRRIEEVMRPLRGLEDEDGAKRSSRL